MLVAELLCVTILHTHLFVSILDWNNFLRSISISVIASYALAINMSSGRMDLSLGGQQAIACLIGGNLAVKLGFGPFGVVLFAMCFGALSGFIAGIAFVTLRLPTFVLGIGTALVYEAISAGYAPGGIQLFGNPKMEILSKSWIYVVTAVLLVVIMYYMMTKSTFGLRYNAIRGGQRVAMNSGINVNRNCLVCFVICGGLIGLSGILDAGYSGYVAASVNLSSTAAAFTGFVPVFLAMNLQRYCHLTIAVPAAVLSFKFISMFLSRCNLSSAASTSFTMALLLVMLVVMGFIGKRNLDKLYDARSLEM